MKVIEKDTNKGNKLRGKKARLAKARRWIIFRKDVPIFDEMNGDKSEFFQTQRKFEGKWLALWSYNDAWSIG